MVSNPFVYMGKQIRMLRENANLSQSELAELLKEHGIHLKRETISKIENGNRSISVAEIGALASIFNVSVETFFEDEEEEKSLVTLFRKKKPLSQEEEAFLDFIHSMVSSLIGQEKIYREQKKFVPMEPIWKGIERN
ncbi:transcriptional regulator with XRE-family HTH domain [Anoxybacillus tepidamans]|uniref:Transcriptional regulator with XRE-family HTH domain n=1 Tax=Anoxybacteroides tepidamans TaxID=265948 RepID=A0A7W8MW60_9BACL|nr:helix-turn-helix transcriptional regulator [Anoxybacillus tepidamans]MBB5325016.1 transcriptional regulator with XRE-family HTH domain [Anoxybacillus tepidamans]